MNTFLLSKSTNPKKKYTVETESGKKISFGAAGYGDYIIYSKKNKTLAKNKKESYLARHGVNENFNDPNTAGFWSRWILWEKPTLKGSIKNVNKKFNMDVKYN